MFHPKHRLIGQLICFVFIFIKLSFKRTLTTSEGAAALIFNVYLESKSSLKISASKNQRLVK